MEDPTFVSSTSQPFFVIYLDHGYKSNPMIPAKFFLTHIKNKNQPMKLKLTSDASDRTWEVKLDGRRFTHGWEDFSAVHSLRDGDVLIFRDNGDMTFHVTASGRSFCEVQCISSDEDEDDIRADSKNFVLKQKPRTVKSSRTEAESSSENSYFVAHVTTSNLRQDLLTIKKGFASSNGLIERCCEIFLMNQYGKSWKLRLRYYKTSGQACIRGGWRDFCLENGLEAGSFYRFKLVRNGTRPLLRYCSKVNKKDYPSERSSTECLGSVSTEQDKFVTITFKPYMLQSGQLRLPRNFVIKNGINKAGKLILVDKDGGKWSSSLDSSYDQGGFYLTKGWRCFATANGLKAGETFTLEFIGVEGTNAMLKFCLKSKIKMEQPPPEEEEHAREDTETRFQKRARISAEGPSRCTAASKKFSADPKNLEPKKPLKTSSISDQVARVKESIVDTLTSVRQFRSELQIKAQNLEASLQEIDALDLM